jgi:hypothetical protein
MKKTRTIEYFECDVCQKDANLKCMGCDKDLCYRCSNIVYVDYRTEYGNSLKHGAFNVCDECFSKIKIKAAIKIKVNRKKEEKFRDFIRTNLCEMLETGTIEEKKG